MATKKKVGDVASVSDPLEDANPLSGLQDLTGAEAEPESAPIAAEPAADDTVIGGSPEHESLLASGYGMSAGDARKIIAERDADPTRWPFEMYRKAQALLEALAAPQGGTTSRRPAPLSGKVQ